MRFTFVAIALLLSAESAWLPAKIRTAKATLSNGSGTSFAYVRPVTIDNASGSALSSFQTLVSTDVYPTTFDAADPSLRGLWHFAEGSGATAADASGHGNTGTLSIGASGGQATSAAAWANGARGRVGGSLSFDGVDDHVALSATPVTGTGSFSIFAWVKTSVTGTRKTIISFGSDTTHNGVWLYVNAANQVAADLCNVAGPVSSVTVTDGKWHHVGVVNTANSFQIWVDGVASGSAMAMSPDLGSVNVPRIGAPMGGAAGQPWYHSGQIDEVRVYDRALSGQEIADHAGLTYGLNAGLVGSWHFGTATSGNVANGALAGLEDTSGNWNNGTASNSNGSGLSFTAGKSGGALSFDGVDDMITVPNSSTLQLATYTVSFWVNFAGANSQQAILYKAVDTGWSRTYSFTRLATGRINFWAGDGVSQYFDRETAPLTAGQWYHVTGTFDGATRTAALYLDGTLQGTATTATFNVVQNTSPLYIGKLPSLTPFAGKIDEVRIYSRVLSTAEIAELASSSPKIRPDLQDLRFAGSSVGADELPYWLESDKKAWVRVGNVPTGTSSIYVFYGNANASFASTAECAATPVPGSAGYAHCGRNTFEFFDDFRGAAIDAARWTETDNASNYITQNERLLFSGGPGTWGTIGMSSVPSFSRANAVMWEFDYKWTGGTYFMAGWKASGAGIVLADLLYAFYSNSNYTNDVYESGASRGDTGKNWVLNQRYRLRQVLKTGGGALYQRSTDGGLTWETWYDSSFSTTASLQIGMIGYNAACEIDNLRVRRGASVDPTTFAEPETVL